MHVAQTRTARVSTAWVVALMQQRPYLATDESRELTGAKYCLLVERRNLHGGKTLPELDSSQHDVRPFVQRHRSVNSSLSTAGTFLSVTDSQCFRAASFIKTLHVSSSHSQRTAPVVE